MGHVILCIDERRSNLEAERLLLEAAGFEVLAAENCEQACELLRDNVVDVALVSDDLQHSEIATCSLIRRGQPSMAVVLQLASYDDPTCPDDVDVVIPKAINPEQKLRLLHSLRWQRAA